MDISLRRLVGFLRGGPDRRPGVPSRSLPASDSLGLAMHLNRYAALLRATGRDDEAVSIEDRVKAIGRPHS